MDVRQKLFNYRSYTPIPFLMLMLMFAHPTTATFLIGLMIALLGEYLRLWGVAIAGSETRTTGPVGGTFLITKGPFAYVRNPLYLGNIVIYLGIGIMSNALFPWLTAVALVYFFFQYSSIVSLEEEYLSSTFGEEYRRYRSSVHRFVPRVSPYEGGEHEQPGLDWHRGLRSERRTLQAVGSVVILLCIRWMVWS